MKKLTNKQLTAVQTAEAEITTVFQKHIEALHAVDVIPEVFDLGLHYRRVPGAKGILKTDRVVMTDLVRICVNGEYPTRRGGC